MSPDLIKIILYIVYNWYITGTNKIDQLMKQQRFNDL